MSPRDFQPGDRRMLNRSRGPGLFTSIQVLCCAVAVAAGVEALAVNPSSYSETERYAASSAALFHLPERQLMQIPLEINTEHADLSQAARAAIEHEVGRLEKCEHHITGCRVAVVAPSTKHRHGGVFRINIWVTIPPHENIVVSHQPSDDRGHKDVLGSIKDAFAAARRQIEALPKH